MKTGLLLSSTLALGLPILGAPILNPANGHYYDSVPSTTANWTDSKAAAEALSHLGFAGHLATITSQEEQDFIVANLPGVTIGYFLGGHQENNVDWLWTTGEPFLYSNWFSGEPNNFQGNAEDYLQFHGYLNDGNPTGFWNDVGNFPSTGFVVEFEPAAVPEPGSSAALLALGVCLTVYPFGRRWQECSQPKDWWAEIPVEPLNLGTEALSMSRVPLKNSQ